MAFEKLNVDDLWRQIPPEEKITLLSRAQAHGVLAVIVMLSTCFTIAVGLQLNWLIWGSLFVSPFIFQFAAGKKWRSLRPVLILEYLAARSAARRYAFNNQGRELNIEFVFRGNIEEMFTKAQVQEELEATLQNVKTAEVWVTLFGDAVVIMKEAPGGAREILAHQLNEKLKISGFSPDGENEYSSHRELIFDFTDKRIGARSMKLTSPYSAALVVFEKKMMALQDKLVKQSKYVPSAITGPRTNALDVVDDFLSPNLFDD